LFDEVVEAQGEVGWFELVQDPLEDEHVQLFVAFDQQFEHVAQEEHGRLDRQFECGLQNLAVLLHLLLDHQQVVVAVVFDDFARMFEHLVDGHVGLAGETVDPQEERIQLVILQILQDFKQFAPHLVFDDEELGGCFHQLHPLPPVALVQFVHKVFALFANVDDFEVGLVLVDVELEAFIDNVRLLALDRLHFLVLEVEQTVDELFQVVVDVFDVLVVVYVAERDFGVHNLLLLVVAADLLLLIQFLEFLRGALVLCIVHVHHLGVHQLGQFEAFLLFILIHQNVENAAFLESLKVFIFHQFGLFRHLLYVMFNVLVYFDFISLSIGLGYIRNIQIILLCIRYSLRSSIMCSRLRQRLLIMVSV